MRNNNKTLSFRFAEVDDFSNLVDYLEKELKILSEEENEKLTSNYSSWILIEELREKFYQQKLVDSGFHIFSSLLDKLTDATQIDHDISTMTFDRSIRPFLFFCSDQRSILQLFINYLQLVNGLPKLSIVQEIVQKWKIPLSNDIFQQEFLDEEFRQWTSLIKSKRKSRTEERFSMEFISRIYEQMLNIPSLKSYQTDFLLLYWYYLAENLIELKRSSTSK